MKKSTTKIPGVKFQVLHGRGHLATMADGSHYLVRIEVDPAEGLTGPWYVIRPCTAAGDMWDQSPPTFCALLRDARLTLAEWQEDLLRETASA